MASYWVLEYGKNIETFCKSCVSISVKTVAIIITNIATNTGGDIDK
ncbi:hypothetical protein [uncultured Cocleimonas sp.]|nr:hypothetical protein [uncultured Cocleimonas sp.]